MAEPECGPCKRLAPDEEHEIRARAQTFCEVVTTDPLRKKECVDFWDRFMKHEVGPKDLENFLYSNYGAQKVEQARAVVVQKHGG